MPKANQKPRSQADRLAATESALARERTKNKLLLGVLNTYQEKVQRLVTDMNVYARSANQDLAQYVASEKSVAIAEQETPSANGKKARGKAKVEV